MACSTCATMSKYDWRVTGDCVARALAWTAIRETWEETGVLIGKTGKFEPTQTQRRPAPLRCGIDPPPAQLEYIVRAVTPTHSPMRFDTRFFMDGGKVGGELIETKELEDIGWHPIQYVTAHLKIMGVLNSSLRRPGEIGVSSGLNTRAERHPVLTRRKGVRVIGANKLDLNPETLSCAPVASVNGYETMAKQNTILVKLVSTADTGYYYVTKKNPRTQTEKLSMRKYDPVVEAR